jgi:hypothetical protein
MTPPPPDILAEQTPPLPNLEPTLRLTERDERTIDVTISAAQRFELHSALVTTWGDDVANTMMEHLPPSGWSDVVRRDDLDHLETRLNLRIDGLERRIDQLEGRMKLLLSGGLAFGLAILAVQVQIIVSIANL